MKTITEHELLLKVGKLNEAVALYELARTDANGNEYQGRGRENDPRGRENDPRSTPPGKWPATDAEIRAFQKANGLVDDGLIGQLTYDKLTKEYHAVPPPGFRIVPTRQHPVVTPPKVTPPHNGTAPKVTPPTMQHQQSDPRVVAIQQDLISKGWPLQPTGIMDQNTSDAYEAQFKTDSINGKFQTSAQPEHSAAYNDAYAAAVKNMDPNQTPVEPKTDYLNNPPASLTTPVKESVTFGQDESLARIVQLVKW
jgi:peptidoglycan hydrolase-like protein with peptidoglycan-binding domain